MKHFDWDPDKNHKLQQERDVSFEDVVTAINDNHLLDDTKHPNQKKYPNQRIFIISIESYAYLIPYVEDDKKIFLKTIIPSRVATKKYIKRKEK